MNEELGRLNYEAYRRERCKVLPNIPFDGWDELLPAQRNAWIAGAEVVAAKVFSDTTRSIRISIEEEERTP